MPNLHKNKIQTSTGEVWMDLTSDTVTAETLLKDVTAHDRSGAQITGTVIVAPTDVTETEDNEAYLYKSSEHDAVYDELVGGSVAWNQLIGASWDSLNKTEGTTFTQNSDGTIHISGTGSGLHFCNSEIEGGLVNGHKYLYSIAGMKAGITSQIYSTTSGSARYIVTSTTNSIGIFTHTAQASDISQFARFYTDTRYSGTTDLKYILIDLTQMFGTTIADYVYNLEQSTAGSGVEWLKSYGFFTKDYYAYNAGGLVSANVDGKKVVGKNLLEITTESTTINGVTFTVDRVAGTITANGTATILTAIPLSEQLSDVLQVGSSYYMTGCPVGGAYYSKYALYVALDNSTVWRDEGSGGQYSVPQSGTLSSLYLLISSGVTVSNLVFKPMIRRADVTDSTFEPYTSITYPIQSTDLRGLYKLNGNKLYTDGDIYSADGTVTRKYGIIDLGTLSWNANGSYGEGQYEYAAVISGKANGVINMICSTMTVQSTASLNCIRGRASSSNVSAVSSETTKEAFKTAMSGVYLIYELATPTTAPAPPFTSPQMVYRNGTEEYLDTRDVPIPVGGNRKYVDIPEWMVNEYFDDLRAETSTISDIIKSCMPLSGGTMTGDILFNVSSAAKALKTTSGNVEIEFDSSALHLSAADVSGQAAQHLANLSLSYDSEADVSVLGAVADLILIGAANWETNISLDENGIKLTIPTDYATTSNLYIDNMKSGSGSEIVIGANGDVYKSSSSRDIKHDIQYIENTDTYHNALMQIKPATYVYNNDKTETTKLGMIAEDIADVMPIAALTGEDGKVENYDTRAIIAMLVMEVQRLNADIRRLRGDTDAD